MLQQFRYQLMAIFCKMMNLKNRIIDYTISATEKYYYQKNNLHFETGNKTLFFVTVLTFIIKRIN